MTQLHWQTAYRELRADSSVRWSLKSALSAAMDCDPCDAVNDARAIFLILKARCDEISGGGDGIVRFNEELPEKIL